MENRKCIFCVKASNLANGTKEHFSEACTFPKKLIITNDAALATMYKTFHVIIFQYHVLQSLVFI